MPIFNPILVRTGGGAAAPASPKEVNFYDYEGTLLHAYTVAQAQALAALPEGPAHEGLVFQGWNWSLADVKALDRPMNVGAMYITDDGKTRLYLRITTRGRMDVPLYFSQTAANGVGIDWGDGSPAETLAGTGYVNTVHTYADVGDYMIALDPAEGCVLGLGAGVKGYCMLGSTDNNGRVYCNMLQKVEIGRNVTRVTPYAMHYCSSLHRITVPDTVTGATGLDVMSFAHCYSLTHINVPIGITSVKNTSFFNCGSLTSVSLPKNIDVVAAQAFSGCSSLHVLTLPDSAKIYSYSFYSCFSLSEVTIPTAAESLGTSVFFKCYALVRIDVPERVQSIAALAFSNCCSVREYHLKPTAPPVLENASAFTGIPSDCIIYVPKGCLAAYQTAANWATYADYMREESA